jgi:glycerophosphoryl diester phosphodiesterase
MPRLSRFVPQVTTRPLVIAHRGASGVAPENTCAAISAAIELGADMVEIDVQLTKDGELVVFHDWTLVRTIRCAEFTRRELRKKRICDLALHQIDALDAGSWWSGKFAGERVPTLRDVLAVCGRRVAVNIELKPRRLSKETERSRRPTAGQPAHETAVIATRLAAALSAHPHVDVVVSSFDHALLARLQRAIPEARLGVLATSRGVAAALSVAAMLKAYSVHIPCSNATPRLANEVHTAGLRLFAYTANHKRAMRRLIAVGVDGIFTDFPDRLRALLQR